MGTGSSFSGFAKLPIPNPFKYIVGSEEQNFQKTCEQEHKAHSRCHKFEHFFLSR
jgi:hypothetical protein